MKKIVLLTLMVFSLSSCAVLDMFLWGTWGLWGASGITTHEEWSNIKGAIDVSVSPENMKIKQAAMLKCAQDGWVIEPKVVDKKSTEYCNIDWKMNCDIFSYYRWTCK